VKDRDEGRRRHNIATKIKLFPQPQNFKKDFILLDWYKKKGANKFYSYSSL
jgi:hypothetical protein